MLLLLLRSLCTVHACFVENDKEKTAKANKAACVAGGVTGVWLATCASAAVTAATGGVAVVAGAGYGIYKYMKKNNDSGKVSLVSR